MLATTPFLLISLTLSTLVAAHPGHPHLERRLVKPILHIPVKDDSDPSLLAASTDEDMKLLFDGNKSFKEKIAKSTEPDLLKKLRVDGQKPPFAFFGCSDSRTGEGNIFDAKPGEFFVERNIANQFLLNDLNSVSALSYSVDHLGIRHIIVMGHYGCGGVAAAITGPPEAEIDAGDGALYSWVASIRQIYLTSTRKAIVDMRNKNGNKTNIPTPEFDDPGFRALIEENVKASVNSIASSPTMKNHYRKLANPPKTDDKHKAPQKVWIHGYVYNIETGDITDLKVTVPPTGPNGSALVPAATVAKVEKNEKPAPSPSPTTSTTTSATGTAKPSAKPKDDEGEGEDDDADFDDGEL